MSFLLMVFLTVVCLFEGYGGLEPLWHEAPAISGLCALAGVVLIGLHALWVSRWVSRALARDPSLREEVLTRYERWRFIHQIGQLGVFVMLLTALGWGWAVYHWWRSGDQGLPGLE